MTGQVIKLAAVKILYENTSPQFDQSKYETHLHTWMMSKTKSQSQSKKQIWHTDLTTFSSQQTNFAKLIQLLKLTPTLTSPKVPEKQSLNWPMKVKKL